MRKLYTLIIALSSIVCAGAWQWIDAGAMAAALLCCLVLYAMHAAFAAYRGYRESYLLGLDMWEDRCFYVLAERGRGELRVLRSGCCRLSTTELTELMRGYANLQVRIAVQTRRMLFRQLEVPIRSRKEMQRMLSYELDYRFPWHSPEWLSGFAYAKTQRSQARVLQQVSLALWHRREYQQTVQQLPPDGFALLSLEPREQALFRAMEAQAQARNDAEGVVLLIAGAVLREEIKAKEAVLSFFCDGVMTERFLLCRDDYPQILDELQRLHRLDAVTAVYVSGGADEFVTAVRDALCARIVSAKNCRWMEAGHVCEALRAVHPALTEDSLAAFGVLG